MQDIFVPHNWRWKLEDGRIWSTKHAAFVHEEEAAAWAESNNMTYIPPSPVDPQGQHSEQGLRDALDFYGLPFGILMPLTEAQAAKRASINAGFDAAMTASLTMPSSSTPPLAFEVAYAIYDWRIEDPDGYAALLAIHASRRDTLLAAVDAATTVEAVQAITVSYAV